MVFNREVKEGVCDSQGLNCTFAAVVSSFDQQYISSKTARLYLLYLIGFNYMIVLYIHAALHKGIHSRHNFSVMDLKVLANISLVTQQFLYKGFDISDDLSVIISDAKCSINVEFVCRTPEALDDLSFKQNINALGPWLSEKDLVTKLSQCDIYGGCQPGVDIDNNSLESAKQQCELYKGNEDQFDRSSPRTPPLVPRIIATPADSRGTPPPIPAKPAKAAGRSLSYRNAIKRRESGSMAEPASPGQGRSPGTGRRVNPGVRRKTQPVRLQMQHSNMETSSDFVYDTMHVTPIIRERTLREKSLGAIGIGARKLWSEMPIVIKQGLAQSLSDIERKIQEGLFEIVSTEHTYKKGLDIIFTHFYASSVLLHESVTSKDDQRILFSNSQQIREISQGLCSEMSKLWNKSCILEVEDMVRILTEFAKNSADAYKVNTRNSIYQERKLNELKGNEVFARELQSLEKDKKSQALSLHSYLTLPMQRITRLPLLLDAVTKRVDPESNSEDYQQLLKCQHLLQEVVKDCNEGARQMANLEEMSDLDKILIFKKVKKIPIVSQERQFVKRGDLGNVLSGSRSGTLSLPKFLDRKPDSLHIILFNDLLLVTKRKGELLEVKDHSPVKSLTVKCMDDKNSEIWLPGGTSAADKEYMFVLALLERKSEYVLKCQSIGERERWVSAIAPDAQIEEEDVDSIYSEWDCPQVQVVMQCSAQESDALSLEVTEVLKVLRKLNDGWYYGERLRNGERGWFHKDYTNEIESEHTRIQNMKKSYDLMIAQKEEQIQRDRRGSNQASTWYNP